MARAQHNLAEPFDMGVSITNGAAAVGSYNVFMIVIKETVATNATSIHIFNKSAGTQYYGTTSHSNDGTNWWHQYTVSLSGNTFSVSGTYSAASIINYGMRTYTSGQLSIQYIYGIC